MKLAIGRMVLYEGDLAATVICAISVKIRISVKFLISVKVIAELA